MSNHIQPEPDDSSIAPEPESSTSDTLNTGAPSVDTASPFRFLQTGAPDLDEALRDHGIENGGVVHLDCAPRQSPLGLGLALCRAALDRGGRAVFLCVPSPVNLKTGANTNHLVRAGHVLDPLLAKELPHFGLALDEENLGDPHAAFRYLVANTPDGFEGHLNNLLPESVEGFNETASDFSAPDFSAPDVIVVYGFERLFSYLPLDDDSPEGWDAEVELVMEATSRLRSWLQTYGARCQASGTNLYLSRSSIAYTRPDDTLFARNLRPLLDATCPSTLYAERTLSHCFCGECPWAVRGRFGVPVSLYEKGVLLTRVLLYVGESEKKVSGPFLDEGQIEASDDNPRRIDYRRGLI